MPSTSDLWGRKQNKIGTVCCNKKAETMPTYRITTMNKGKSVLTSTEEANLRNKNFHECKSTIYDVVEVMFDSQSLLGSHSSSDSSKLLTSLSMRLSVDVSLSLHLVDLRNSFCSMLNTVGELPVNKVFFSRKLLLLLLCG